MSRPPEFVPDYSRRKTAERKERRLHRNWAITMAIAVVFTWWAACCVDHARALETARDEAFFSGCHQ